MPSSAIIVRAPPTCRPPDECRHSFLTHRGFNAHTYVGDHDSVLRAQVLPRFEYRDRARAMCLLDPYGLAVKWSLIKAIADMRTVEIFFNFMVVGMNRNVLWRDASRVTPTRRLLMTDGWGDESWQEAVYRQQPDLFGGVTLTKVLGNEALVADEELTEGDGVLPVLCVAQPGGWEDRGGHLCEVPADAAVNSASRASDDHRVPRRHRHASMDARRAA
jgi:hypothetical protein